MKTIENPPLSMDALADLEYALHLHATGQRDAAFEQRIGEQSAKIREDIIAGHGVRDVSVELIREGR